MRRLVRVSGVLVALAVSVLATTACEARGRNTQSQNVSHPRPVYCTILADSPKRDAEPATSIVARVRFRCDRPGADSMSVTVRLEKRDGRTWRVVRTQSFTVRGSQTHAEFVKYHSRQVTVGCGAGRFRTAVEWKRRSRGTDSTGSTNSGAAIDPCAPRIFS